MASLFRSTAAASSSRLPTFTCSSLGPSSLRRSMAVQVDTSLIIPSETTYHVTNPQSRLTAKARKRQKAVLLREDHPKLGFRGDVVSVNKTYARQLYSEDIAAPILPGGGSPHPTIPLPYAPTIKEFLHTPAASDELRAKLPLWDLLRSPPPEGRKRMTFMHGLPKGYELKAMLVKVEEERLEKLKVKELEEMEEERRMLEKLEKEMERYGLVMEKEEEEGKEESKQ